jgi:hypothetical protein
MHAVRSVQHAAQSALTLYQSFLRHFGNSDLPSSALECLILPTSSQEKFARHEDLAHYQKKWREDAYEVCYYFDYLGVLVSFGIIREELVISLWGTTIIQVWLAAEPLISKERAHRRITYSAGISPGFLVYYEDLVCRIMARGGRDAARQIQEQSGLRQLNEPLNKLTVRSDKVLNA